MQPLKKIQIPPYFWALGAMLFWGLSFIWSSILLRYYEPVTIIFIRLILSSLMLFSFILVSGVQQKIRRRDLKYILLGSLFNPFLYFFCENYGLKYSTPTIAAVIIATIPVFSPLVAWLTYRERLTILNFLGIFISFGGILLMLMNSESELAVDPAGVLFLFGAVFAALLYSVNLRKLTARYSSVNLVAYQNFIGIFLFLPLFLLLDAEKAIEVPLNLTIITSFLLLALFASSVAFVFFAQSVKVLGISKSNIFSNLIPVFTAIFSYLLMQEAFTLRKLMGMTIVIAGVFLSEITKKKSG